MPTSYNYIIQLSLTKQGFELLSFLEDGSTKHRYIDLRTTISEQTELLFGILADILEQLVVEDREHKERFREEKLAALFHPSISYHSSKVVEAAFLDNEPVLGLINLEIVIEAAHRFREAIKKRNMDLYESLAHEYKLLEHVDRPITFIFPSQDRWHRTSNSCSSS